MKVLRIINVLCLSMCLCGASQKCFAEGQAQPESADQHDEEGARLYTQKQYEAALREFRAAYNTNQVPRYLFNIGQCYRKLGLAPEAVEYFQRYLDEEKSADPTLRADLNAYINQVHELQDRANGHDPARPAPEPSPFLIADEILDLEELTDQIVRDFKAGDVGSRVRRGITLRRSFPQAVTRIRGLCKPSAATCRACGTQSRPAYYRPRVRAAAGRLLTTDISADRPVDGAAFCHRVGRRAQS